MLAPTAPPPMMTTSARAGSSLTRADARRWRPATYAVGRVATEGADVRAVVFAGAGGNEVIRLEERPDPVPGSQELLVHVTHAGLNPADLSQREGSYPAPPGSPQDVPGLEVAGTVEACGAQVLGCKPGDRVFGLVGGGGLADRVVVHEPLRRGRCPTRSTSPARLPCPRRSSPRTTRSAAGRPATRARRCSCTARPAAWAGRPADRRASRAPACSAPCAAIRGRSRRARARRRADRRRGLRRRACWRRPAGSGADVIIELVGAPHFPDNLRAVAMLGRIVDRRPRRGRRGLARASAT